MDYIELTDSTIYFPDNNTVGTQMCAIINIIDDMSLELFEYFLVTLRTSDANVNIENSQIMVGIFDNEGKLTA